ncbi:MAG: hypothetical protein GY929_19885 [Actinomycetia bacterium]|nr:hypothetical protein [Actinomycetes bacterium]
MDELVFGLVRVTLSSTEKLDEFATLLAQRPVDSGIQARQEDLAQNNDGYR